MEEDFKLNEHFRRSYNELIKRTSGEHANMFLWNHTSYPHEDLERTADEIDKYLGLKKNWYEVKSI